MDCKPRFIFRYRYSLDIARLTKRKSVPGDISGDEDLVATPKQKNTPKPVSSSVSKLTESPGKRRGRGRPPKSKVPGSSPGVGHRAGQDTTSSNATVTISSPARTVEPRVLMSPSDKKIAESVRLKGQSLLEAVRDDPDENDSSTAKDEPGKKESEHKVPEVADAKDTTQSKETEAAEKADEPMETTTDPDTAGEPDTKDSEEKMETDETSKTAPVQKALQDIVGTETPSDVLARKLDIPAAEASASSESEGKVETESSSEKPPLADFVSCFQP